MKNIKPRWQFFHRIVFAALSMGLFLLPIRGFSQGIANVSIPPSPEASALALYAEVPVSNYTGLPQIAVPLGELVSRGLSLPISLSYHASGIRVDQIASREGLGWVLNAGGAITRTVNGAPDENGGYFSDKSLCPPLGAPSTSTENLNGYTASEFQRIRSIASGGLDGTPDRFQINFPGGSGQVIFDQNNQPVIAPYSLMEMSVDWNAGTWTVRTPDGTKWYFGGAGAMETTIHFSDCGDPTPPFVSAWYLTKVEGPWGDEILLEYESDGVHASPERESRTEYAQTACLSKAAQICNSGESHTAIRLKKISGASGHVEFEYGQSPREDLPQSERLASIHFHDSEGIQRKTFSLGHSYWSGRLMLDWVYEKGDVCTRKPANRFFYDKSHKLPGINSYSQDHWGFFNGKQNTSLVPRTVLGDCNVIGEADREPDFEFGKCGALTKVQLPTGGETILEYEAHDAWVNNGQLFEEYDTTQGAAITWNGAMGSQTASFVIDFDQCIGIELDLNNLANPVGECDAEAKLLDGNGMLVGSFNCSQSGIQSEYLQAGSYSIEVKVNQPGDEANMQVNFKRQGNQIENRLLGGLRIKRITVADDPDPANNMVKEYVYRSFDHPERSTGRIITDPRYTFVYTQGVPLGNQLSWQYCNLNAVLSAPRGGIGNSQGSHVVYQEVQVLSGDAGSNGKTVYHYTSTQEFPEPVPSFPFGPERNLDYKRGLLKASEMYDSNGVLVQTIENEYVFRPENKVVQLGFKAGVKQQNMFDEQPVFEQLYYQTFEWVSEWFYLGSTTTRNYGENGVDFMEQTQHFEYDQPSHGLQTGSWTTDSDGRKVIRRSRYVGDFASGNGDEASSAISTMKNQLFMLAAPVEQCSYEQWPGQAEKLISANLTLYKEFDTGRIFPSQFYELRTETPLPGFAVSSISPAGFQMDNRYILREEAKAYSPFGRLLRAKRKDGLEVSWKWDKNDLYPTGEILNGSLAGMLDGGNGAHLNADASFADFESGLEASLAAADDYWAFQGVNAHSLEAHTGRFSRRVLAGANQYGPIREFRPEGQERSFSFSAWVKTPAGYSGGKLILYSKEDLDNNAAIYPPVSLAPSYREIAIPSTNGEWQYLEVKLDMKKIRELGGVPSNVPLRITASILNQDPNADLLVDDLRFQPADAHMSTFTYDAFGLKTSESDANGVSTHFEYDPLMRLTVARDEDRNILLRHRYQYANKDLDIVLNANSPVYNGQAMDFWVESMNQCPDDLPVEYRWDFGDGQSATTTSTSASHSYANPGSYAATVTTTYPGGSQSTQAKAVLVLASIPPLSNGFSIAINGVPAGQLSIVGQGDIVQVTANPTGGLPAYSYDWEIREGSTLLPLSGMPNNPAATSFTVAGGSFRVRCTITDTAGTAASFETDLFIVQTNN